MNKFHRLNEEKEKEKVGLARDAGRGPGCFQNLAENAATVADQMRKQRLRSSELDQITMEKV